MFQAISVINCVGSNFGHLGTVTCEEEDSRKYISVNESVQGLSEATTVGIRV